MASENAFLHKRINNGDGTKTLYWSDDTSSIIGTKTKTSGVYIATTEFDITEKRASATSTKPPAQTQTAIAGATKVTTKSPAGLPLQENRESPAAAKSASLANKDIVMVDISKDENYRKYFQQNPGKNLTGHENLLDKKFADELVSYAKEKNIKYVYNSAYRRASDMPDDGTSHLAGQSIDVETVVYGDEINPDGSVSAQAIRDAVAEKDLCRNEMISDWHGNNTSYKGKLVSGSVVYSTAQNPSGVLYPITGSGGDVNASPQERWHIGYQGATVVDDNSAEVKARDQMAAEYDEKLKTDPTVTGVVSDKSGNIEAVKIDSSGNFIETVKIGQVRRMTTDGLRNVRYETAAANAANGKVSQEYVSLIRTQPKIPRDLSGEPVNRAVKVDTQQLNNLRNVSESDYKINANTNKLIKNAYNDRLPFGLQNKHDGPAAAIKLVLDKLFANNLTPAAQDAWKQIKSTGIDYIDNFLIERMTKVDEERYNIAQSVSDEYKIYFSGRRPTVMSISGKLYNTYNQQWWYDFDYFYDNFLRGSRAVENRIRAFLTIADAVYEIIILKFAVNGDSNFDNLLTFNLDYVLLQTLHTGEYKNPSIRGSNDSYGGPAPLSAAQTELTPDMAKFVDNYVNTVMPAAAGMPGMPQPFTTPDANAPEKAKSREDLKKSDYANMEKQILLNKSNINNIDENKLTQAAAGHGLFDAKGPRTSTASEFSTQPSKFTDEAGAVNTKYNNTSNLRSNPKIGSVSEINTKGNTLNIQPLKQEIDNTKAFVDHEIQNFKQNVEPGLRGISDGIKENFKNIGQDLRQGWETGNLDLTAIKNMQQAFQGKNLTPEQVVNGLSGNKRVSEVNNISNNLRGTEKRTAERIDAINKNAAPILRQLGDIFK